MFCRRALSLYTWYRYQDPASSSGQHTRCPIPQNARSLSSRHSWAPASWACALRTRASRRTSKCAAHVSLSSPAPPRSCAVGAQGLAGCSRFHSPSLRRLGPAPWERRYSRAQQFPKESGGRGGPCMHKTEQAQQCKNYLQVVPAHYCTIDIRTLCFWFSGCT